jgi:nucleotidyltransferase substrate binding protein (TIGR01987 family)
MTKLNNLIKDLKKANQRLKEAMELKPTRINKDATIQRFEFTFELSWKTMQEYIKNQGLECFGPNNCIREAARIKLIGNPKQWIGFLKARNLIAHTYNEKMADRIYKTALKFPKEVDKLLQKIVE